LSPCLCRLKKSGNFIYLPERFFFLTNFNSHQPK
jgi:hypothetical protein